MKKGEGERGEGEGPSQAEGARGGFARISSVLRLAIGAALAWRVVFAITAPELPAPTRLLAALVFSIALWRPAAGLTLAVAFVPAGALLAPAPARAAELLRGRSWSAWLLRRLAPAG